MSVIDPLASLKKGRIATRGRRRQRKPVPPEFYESQPSRPWTADDFDFAPTEVHGEPGWTERPCYYASVMDGPQLGLLAGPYPDHEAALAVLKSAKIVAEKVNFKAVFYSFGTVLMRDGSNEGRLNDLMRITIRRSETHG